MRTVNKFGVALAIVATIACKSQAQKQAEEAAKQAEQAAEAMQKAAEAAGKSAAAQGAEGAAAGMEAFAKAMQAAAGAAAGNDGKPVDPVSFQLLETALPDVSGWEREKPTGERMTMPVPFSQTEATYRNGDAQVDVKIVDSAFSQLLVAPWAMFLTAGYEKQTSDGYEKSINLGGNPGFEKWDTEDKDGEVNLVVAKRFLVTVEGHRVKDVNVLHDFVSKVDAGKLAGLK